MVCMKEEIRRERLVIHWRTPEVVPLLCENEVHLWVADLRQPQPLLERVWEQLARDERERAERFRFGVHRDRYVAGRGMLRQLLASYLGSAPAEIELACEPAGKPRLAQVGGVEFNLAHCGDLAIYAFSPHPVGVDIEEVRLVPDYLEVAENFFAPGECARLRALDPSEQPEAFLRCWTRKEAWLKTSGAGIAEGLKTFEVSFEASAEPAVIRGGSEEGSLHHFDPAEGFVGAVHVMRPHPRLRCLQYSPGLQGFTSR